MKSEQYLRESSSCRIGNSFRRSVGRTERDDGVWKEWKIGLVGSKAKQRGTRKTILILSQLRIEIAF